jgi:hypothetical protein
MYSLLFVVALALSTWGCVALYQQGQYRDEKVMRSARMIDTNAIHTQHKSNHYYNTNGYFVDHETGLRFSDRIGDGLYRQFERGGNKPIEVTWPYSIDQREQSSWGVMFKLFGIIGLLFCTIFAGLLIAREIFRFKEQRSGRH